MKIHSPVKIGRPKTPELIHKTENVEFMDDGNRLESY